MYVHNVHVCVYSCPYFSAYIYTWGLAYKNTNNMGVGKRIGKDVGIRITIEIEILVQVYHVPRCTLSHIKCFSRKCFVLYVAKTDIESSLHLKTFFSVEPPYGKYVQIHIT